MTQTSRNFYGNGNRGPSLGEQIESAETVGEVKSLLADGNAYVGATQRTKNRWKRLAKARVRLLEGRA